MVNITYRKVNSFDASRSDFSCCQKSRRWGNKGRKIFKKSEREISRGNTFFFESLVSIKGHFGLVFVKKEFGGDRGEDMGANNDGRIRQWLITTFCADEREGSGPEFIFSGGVRQQTTFFCAAISQQRGTRWRSVINCLDSHSIEILL